MIRRAFPLVLAVVTVLLEIGYPLTSGHPRDVLTVVTVVAFFLACASHAAVHRGVGWAAGMVLLTGGVGLLAEAVGTATGVPFGHYTYANTLGHKAFGVPLVIPLAWSMMAYPALLLGRRLSGSRVTAALLGGWALASWDLFLDPQMVAAGHWRWSQVRHALPGAPRVPVSNYLGWLAVAVVLLALLQLLPRRPADERVPAGLLLWTYASSVLANAVFFGRPLTALVGGVGMGAVVLPYAAALRR